MDTDNTKVKSSWIAAATAIAKDIVSLLRDGALFLLAVLLLLFPAKFNSMLTEAGFKEGNIAGLKWVSKLKESNVSLEQSQLATAALQGNNDELLKALREANSRMNDPKLSAQVAKFEEDNKSLKMNTKNVQAKVTETIDSNIPLVEKGQASKEKRYYVIAMTSANREDIVAEIERVKKRVGATFDKDFPNIEPYAPEGGLYTLLINGKSLPYDQAAELKRRATKAGFSKDTWLWQNNVEYFSAKE